MKRQSNSITNGTHTHTRTHTARDLALAEVGLTAEQIDHALDEIDVLEDTLLNLSCSEAGCMVATNEFELVSSAHFPRTLRPAIA